MVSLAISSCFIPVFGFILSIIFLILSKKIEQKYLKILLQITCVIVWLVCARNCIISLQILKRQWIFQFIF